MIPAIKAAQARLCVCLYPVVTCSDGFFLVTNSGGKARYLVAILDSGELFIHRFTRREIEQHIRDNMKGFESC